MRAGKVIYVAGFSLKKNSGRNKATREKADALRGLLGDDRFRLYAPRGSGNPIADCLLLGFFDLQMFFRSLFFSSDTVVIQRQTFLFISNAFLRLRKIKVVGDVHAEAENELQFLNKNLFGRTLSRLLISSERSMLKLSSGIICNHPLLRNFLEEKYRKPCIYSYNGANIFDFKVMDAAECRAKLGLDPNGKYFLFLGMISKWHGVGKLIEIFKEENMQAYQLLLVGAIDTGYVSALRRSALGYSNIIFIDHVDTGTAARWVNASDVCLLPVNDIRTSPGSPLKLYDYIACGKPVIAQQNVQGYSDEVEKYHLGEVVDFNDTVSASRLLSGFIRNADMSSYQHNNRRVAEQNVSWNERMKHWLEFIRSI